MISLKHMTIIQTWGDALSTAFSGFAPAFLQFGAYLLAAIIIFAVGWILGAFLDGLVEKLFVTLKIDNILRQAGIEGPLNKGDIKLNSGAFVGGLIRWFVIAVFFLAALKVFGLVDVSNYLETIIVGYLPRVIASILILLVSVIIGEVAKKVVSGAAANAHITSSKVLGSITKWAIVVFAVLTALVQLDIASALVQILFIGIVVAFSLAFGLAFGLGGKEVAARILEKSLSDISKR
ncbi:MAG: hypothetical protein K9M11_04305 [Candidatus Pacebacteria bacterium]|nr:hypothetical protein [Candidatus Paceibacterota bacterium]